MDCPLEKSQDLHTHFVLYITARLLLNEAGEAHHNAPACRAIWTWDSERAAQRAEGAGGSQEARVHLCGAAHDPMVGGEGPQLPPHSALQPLLRPAALSELCRRLW